ncbi:CCAAT/enhancer-binding protein zeta [Gracilariopsis chorda]|uniref:CCAAT/enhancer-binding protein zeta n=1 Tax=Gracilariopsis chorda TaxID=448386 RepID=A0A2V3J129_9FLOR|nr:CCAAT/enhancer-binding protein zeta [Gracilariopsis chorda]|eukprot:PXF48122.1 CCAAT/enhancer-binding protein zeta [Gracilariopsis chorda]
MGRPSKAPISERVLGLHQLPGQVLADEDVNGEYWYECAPKWPEEGLGGPTATLSLWKEVATKALSSASEMFEKKVNNASSAALKRALDKEKTVGDKIAAETLLVQESPVHRLDELRNLLGFASKKKRRERNLAIDALKDLFIHNLLPNDRRLVFFEDRVFSCGKGELTKRHLIYALYETELKSIYREFLQILEECARDPLTFMKEIAVKTMTELLIEKPENESALLAMLVNKLGDPERKVSSLASQQLISLIYRHHPQMRLVVIKEVERLVLRQNVTRKTQYYAINFLNQIRFSNEDVELARRFVRLYMDLFTRIISEDDKSKQEKPAKSEKTKIKRVMKRGRISKKKVKTKEKVHDSGDSRLIGALLIGVNRAFPYTRPEEETKTYEAYYDALFRVAHAKSMASATQALAFLLQVSQANSTQSDRLYNALYSRIFDLPWSAEEKQAAFMNLVYKAMKADTSTKRMKAFMKRLLQASLFGSSGFAGACVMVISESLSGKDVGLLRSYVSMGENEDEEEVFDDVEVVHDRDEKESNPTVTDESKEDMPTLKDPTKLRMNGASKEIRSAPIQKGLASNTTTYDPLKRDPRFAGAEKSSLWEILGLSSHFHPSVSMFARSICKNLQALQYNGDPLKDFAEIAFLDKFSYKKAKNRVAKSLHGKRSGQYRDDPIPNSQQFQNFIQNGTMGEDNEFFARFFRTNPHRVVSTSEEQKAGVRDADDEIPGYDDASDIDSEEEAFEKAMHAEMRRLGGGKGLLDDSKGVEVNDPDEDDDDELKAFDLAFGNEGEESDDLEDSQNTNGQQDSGTKSRQQQKLSGGLKSSGVFMSLEDFEQAVEAGALAGSASVQDGMPLSKTKSRRRRVRSGKESRTESKDPLLSSQRQHHAKSFTGKQDLDGNISLAKLTGSTKRKSPQAEDHPVERKRRRKRKADQ